MVSETKLTKIKKVPLSQAVTKQLTELILSGELQQGERLPNEQQMTEIFGVGRSSVREAIRALVALGLVEVRIPEGTFVAKYLGGFFTKDLEMMSRSSFKTVEELMEARVSIEVDIVELAVQKAKEEDIRVLEEILKTEEDDINTLEELQKADSNELEDNSNWKNNRLFHQTIAKMADNSFLYQSCEILEGITISWLKKTGKFAVNERLAHNQHKEILKAIQNRDAAMAVKKMEKHMLFTKRQMKKINDANQTEEQKQSE